MKVDKKSAEKKASLHRDTITKCPSSPQSQAIRPPGPKRRMIQPKKQHIARTGEQKKSKLSPYDDNNGIFDMEAGVSGSDSGSESDLEDVEADRLFVDDQSSPLKPSHTQHDRMTAVYAQSLSTQHPSANGPEFVSRPRLGQQPYALAVGRKFFESSSPGRGPDSWDDYEQDDFCVADDE